MACRQKTQCIDMSHEIVSLSPKNYCLRLVPPVGVRMPFATYLQAFLLPNNTKVMRLDHVYQRGAIYQCYAASQQSKSPALTITRIHPCA